MSTNTIPSASSHFINLTTATGLTDKYRTDQNGILATSFQNQDILPLSETFNRADIETLLDQDGCEAMRIYYGMDGDDKVHAILVAVNEDNEDILPSQNIDPGVDIILEEGQRCPIFCPPASALNS